MVWGGEEGFGAMITSQGLERPVFISAFRRRSVESSGRGTESRARYRDVATCASSSSGPRNDADVILLQSAIHIDLKDASYPFQGMRARAASRCPT